jgi:hypothetical protein
MFKLLSISQEEFEAMTRKFAEGTPLKFSSPHDRIIIFSGILVMFAETMLKIRNPLHPILFLREKNGPYAAYDLFELYAGNDIKECWRRIGEFLLEEGADMYALISEATANIEATGVKLTRSCAIVRAEERSGFAVFAPTYIKDDPEGGRGFDIPGSPPPNLFNANEYSDSLLIQKRSLN